MKKLLFVFAAGIALLTSCEKSNNNVKPNNFINKVEGNMWQAEDGAIIEFVPTSNSILEYEPNVPLTEDPMSPTVYSYNLLSNGDGSINNEQVKFTIDKNGKLLIGDKKYRKSVKVNTNVKNPTAGAKNKDWKKVIEGKYTVDFDFNGLDDNDNPLNFVSIKFIGKKGLVIVNDDYSKPSESRYFQFKDDELYFGEPKDGEVGFSLQSYNPDKIELKSNDGIGLMYLYPIL